MTSARRAPDRALSQAPTGYLRATTVDASDDPGLAPRRTSQTPAAALRTTFVYDRVGNVVTVTNPRGVVTQLEVNALNEVVSTIRGADVAQAVASGQLLTGEAPLRYRARSFFDHNGRVVKTEVENRDSTTQGVGAYVETWRTYDILGDLLSTTVEVDATTRLTTTFRYDPNQNPVAVTAPEGNRVVTTYDERDLVHTVTRGADTPDASTVAVDYDRNGNRVRTTDAEDTDGDGAPESTTFVLDGFDRLIEARDPLGNRALTSYDVAGQVVRSQVIGHPAGAPAGAHVLLSDVRFSHDEIGRVVRTDAALLISSGFATVRPVTLTDHDGDGFVTSRVEYDALSRPTAVVEDDQEVTRTAYDGAGRTVETIDALGNRVVTHYDQGSNPVLVRALEVSPEGLVPTETFTTRYVYDQLGRLVRATDSAGQTTRFVYDSRDNLVLRSDPEGPLTADPLGVFPGPINGPGNTTRFVHDGMGRVLRQLIDLRVGGTGAGALDTSNPSNPDGLISLGYVFDGNSRLTGIVDDNGNRTSFTYDALDRKRSQTNADGESYTFTYDRDGNVRTVTDPNGTVVTKTYDALNRLVELTAARAPGVLGTTRETYAYDGLSRLVRATDDNGHAATALQVVEYVYDSLGRTLEEHQNGRTISSVYTGDGKRAQVTYPGGRSITRTFDALDRIKQLRDGSTVLATTDWIGPGLRELRRVNGNATTLTFLNDATNADVGYDAVQRITRLRVLAASAGAPPIVDREYAYNRASQRTLERRHEDGGLTDRYVYDSAYRVVSSSYDQEGLTGTVPRDLTQVAYRYDGVGNRRLVERATSSAGVLTQAITVNAVNEYVSVGGVARTNDDNGNLTDDGTRLLHYDYKNRLVAVSDKASMRPVAAYEYLPDGRRAKKVVFAPDGSVAKATAFFYDGAQEVEEQDAGSGATKATYVWSPVYVDELVTYTNSAGTFYTHQDARCDVVAITDAAGAVVERVRYDDFGRAEIRGPGGEARAASAVGCAYGFQGRRLDAETGLLYFRARYYDPATGRFVQRDPVWDAGNVGGQYTFVGNNPATWLDPLGTWCLKQVAADLSGWSDVKTAFGGAGAEWDQGNYGWATLYAVGGAFIAVDSVLSFIPGVGQGKALVKTGVKEGLEYGVKSALKEGGQEGLERLGREGAETGLGRVDNVFDSRFADDPRLGDTAPIQWSDANSQSVFADLVQTEEGRGALANLVTEDVNAIKFVPFLPGNKAGTTIVDKATGSIDVLVSTNNRSMGNIGKTLVHEADHVGDAAKRGTLAGEIQAEEAARRHVNEILTGSSALSDAERAAVAREAADLYPDLR